MGLAVLCFGLVLAVFERWMAIRSPQLIDLAKRVPSVGAAFSFDYTRDVLTQLSGLATSLGALQHLQTVAGISDKRPTSKQVSAVGAQGFVTVDIDSNIGGIFLRRVDNLVAAYLTTLEEYELALEEEEGEFQSEDDGVEGNEHENTLVEEEDELEDESEFPIDEEESLAEEDDVEDENLLSDPLHDVIDSAWNGGFLTVGSAVNFDLSYEERLKLGAALLASRSDSFLKSIVVRALPLKLQQYLAHETMGHSSFHTEFGSVSGIHHGYTNVTAGDLVSYLDGICPESSVGWDGCSMFGMERESVRNMAENIFAFIDEDFEIQLDFYWAFRGTTLVWSNKASYVEALLEKSEFVNEPLNPLVPVLARAKPRGHAPHNVTFSVGANYKRIQDDVLQMLALLRANVRRETLASIDLLSTPQADELLVELEEGALELSQRAQSQSFEVSWNSARDRLQTSLWILPSPVFFENEAAFTADSTNQLFNTIKRLLVANSTVARVTMVPFDNVTTSNLEQWQLVESVLSPHAIAPLVQRRMRALNKGARGIF